VEWAGALPLQPQLTFVTTQTTQTDVNLWIDGSATYIVDNNVSPILSESYGACEAGLRTGEMRSTTRCGSRRRRKELPW